MIYRHGSNHKENDSSLASGVRMTLAQIPEWSEVSLSLSQLISWGKTQGWWGQRNPSEYLEMLNIRASHKNKRASPFFQGAPKTCQLTTQCSVLGHICSTVAKSERAKKQSPPGATTLMPINAALTPGKWGSLGPDVAPGWSSPSPGVLSFCLLW